MRWRDDMSSENVDERKEEEGKSVFSQMEEKKWDQAQIKIRQWMKRRTDSSLLLDQLTNSNMKLTVTFSLTLLY